MERKKMVLLLIEWENMSRTRVALFLSNLSTLFFLLLLLSDPLSCSIPHYIMLSTIFWDNNTLIKTRATVIFSSSYPLFSFPFFHLPPFQFPLSFYCLSLLISHIFSSFKILTIWKCINSPQIFPIKLNEESQHGTIMSHQFTFKNKKRKKEKKEEEKKIALK